MHAPGMAFPSAQSSAPALHALLAVARGGRRARGVWTIAPRSGAPRLPPRALGRALPCPGPSAPLPLCVLPA
eukprot:11180204-Lingulodinium_polyedra.AAC.1